jgi:hypothetical protein
LGGGYVFGVALHPVRVEARASETVHGYSIWQAMDQSACLGCTKQTSQSSMELVLILLNAAAT